MLQSTALTLTTREQQDQEDAVLELWIAAEVAREPLLTRPRLQGIWRTAEVTEELAKDALRAYIPQYKKDMSTSVLSGDLWIQDCLQHENDRYMRETFGMTAVAFNRLCHELALKDARSVTKELQLAMFLLTVKGPMHLRLLAHRVQRAKTTISTYFQLVLHRLTERPGFYSSFVRMPDAKAPIHPFIRRDYRYHGYFNDCIGAVDGTHIPVFRKGQQVEDPDNADDLRSWRDRYGNISWACLAVCDFSLRFLYVLPGFEGAAHDSKLLDFAMRKDLKLPEGKWLLGDNGFPLCDVVLTPFIGVRYHLQEWRRYFKDRGHNQTLVKDYAELFNLRHASARNVVERAFDVLKARFPILNSAPQYALDIQSLIFPALCALHNYLLVHNDAGLETLLIATFDSGQAEQSEGARADGSDSDSTCSVNQTETTAETSSPSGANPGNETDRQRLNRCSARRKRLAKRMWDDYCNDVSAETNEKVG